MLKPPIMRRRPGAHVAAGRDVDQLVARRRAVGVEVVDLDEADARVAVAPETMAV
jgi:hypothetical protein